jgi:hypothetical protein
MEEEPHGLDTSVSFSRKELGLTHTIQIAHLVGSRPEKLIEMLAVAGFAENLMQRMPAAVNGIELVWLFKRGGGLFGDWTAAEKRANMKAARAILARFGFARVPVNTLTYADLA